MHPFVADRLKWQVFCRPHLAVRHGSGNDLDLNPPSTLCCVNIPFRVSHKVLSLRFLKHKLRPVYLEHKIIIEMANIPLLNYEL